MKNWHKWTLSIGAGFLGGVCGCALDAKAQPQDYLRHGMIETVPAIAALKMTLSKDDAE